MSAPTDRSAPQGATFEPGRHRAFVHVSRAWYSSSALFDPRVVDEVSISMGGEERQGVDYEFSIRWIELGAGVRKDVVPQIRVFDDSWLAFAELADVFAWLASMHGKSPSPDDVCAALLRMGIEDFTEETRGEPRS